MRTGQHNATFKGKKRQGSWTHRNLIPLLERDGTVQPSQCTSVSLYTFLQQKGLSYKVSHWIDGRAETSPETQGYHGLPTADPAPLGQPMRDWMKVFFLDEMARKPGRAVLPSPLLGLPGQPQIGTVGWEMSRLTCLPWVLRWNKP